LLPFDAHHFGTSLVSTQHDLTAEPSPESRQQRGFTFVQGGLDIQI